MYFRDTDVAEGFHTLPLLDLINDSFAVGPKRNLAVFGFLFEQVASVVPLALPPAARAGGLLLPYEQYG
ncbi:hypothetical protein F2Q70_00012202 [Brassica cretica]|nr:hypothetical protein F2Q70_00012202 [Brassica cretica]